MQLLKKRAEIKHVVGIKNFRNSDLVSHFLSKNATADVFSPVSRLQGSPLIVLSLPVFLFLEIISILATLRMGMSQSPFGEE